MYVSGVYVNVSIVKRARGIMLRLWRIITNLHTHPTKHFQIVNVREVDWEAWPLSDDERVRLYFCVCSVLLTLLGLCGTTVCA